MNWLITGGCGFIGKNLLKHLIKNRPDDAFRVMDNYSVGKPIDLAYAGEFIEHALDQLNWKAGKIECTQGDICNEADIKMSAKGADVIVHLAANTGVGPSVENPKMDCITNVIGTLYTLEAARENKVGRFVFASSGAPIGTCTPPIHEEMPCHPESPYGASKLAGEGYCSAYHKSFGINTVALRFGNVYGPGSTHKSSVVAKFIRLAMAGETLEIYGDGSQTRDFIYIGDLVRAIVKAATTGDIGGEVYQIATNNETTVNELSETLIPVLEKEMNKKIEVVYGPKRVGDVMRNFSDTSKAKEELNWVCETDLELGIKNTLNFFLTTRD